MSVCVRVRVRVRVRVEMLRRTHPCRFIRELMGCRSVGCCGSGGLCCLALTFLAGGPPLNSQVFGRVGTAQPRLTFFLWYGCTQGSATHLSYVRVQMIHHRPSHDPKSVRWTIICVLCAWIWANTEASTCIVHSRQSLII